MQHLAIAAFLFFFFFKYSIIKWKEWLYLTNENKKKTKILLFFIFISFILAANYILFRIPVLGPVPSGAVIGSILDFMIVIPLLAYFFIIRKRYSLKYLGFVIAASYGAAYFIIPNEHFSQYSFLPYIVFLSEHFSNFKFILSYLLKKTLGSPSVCFISTTHQTSMLEFAFYVR